MNLVTQLLFILFIRLIFGTKEPITFHTIGYKSNQILKSGAICLTGIRNNMSGLQKCVTDVTQGI